MNKIEKNHINNLIARINAVSTQAKNSLTVDNIKNNNIMYQDFSALKNGINSLEQSFSNNCCQSVNNNCCQTCQTFYCQSDCKSNCSSVSH